MLANPIRSHHSWFMIFMGQRFFNYNIARKLAQSNSIARACIHNSTCARPCVYKIFHRNDLTPNPGLSPLSKWRARRRNPWTKFSKNWGQACQNTRRIREYFPEAGDFFPAIGSLVFWQSGTVVRTKQKLLYNSWSILAALLRSSLFQAFRLWGAAKSRGGLIVFAKGCAFKRNQNVFIVNKGRSFNMSEDKHS